MFESLSTALQKTFKTLKGHGKISDKNITDALREIRLALLEADVNYQVTKEFIARVKEKCLGEDVLKSITPGQQIIKRIHEEMIETLGGTHQEISFTAKPTKIMLLGLHGAGKTTTASKLALRWKNQGKTVLLVACDIRRPAAIEQLKLLSKQVQVGILVPKPNETIPEIGKRAVIHAEQNNIDVALFDTGGRLQIDDELMEEIKALKNTIIPEQTILVLDAAIGQESMHVANTFNQHIGLSGLILTKLDGDARGGAAISARSVTGCPILLVGTGEKPEDLDAFYPDRIASRILGMGDVISLVERAQVSFDLNQAMELDQKIKKNSLDFEDLLKQFQYMKKLGPIDSILDMIPGAGNISQDQKSKLKDLSAKEAKKSEAIILSMTPKERRNPPLINASRKRRIAQGSGTDVRDVNELLKKFNQTKKMSKSMKKMQKRLLRMGM